MPFLKQVPHMVVTQVVTQQDPYLWKHRGMRPFFFGYLLSGSQQHLR